jgi:hypothetical protein
MTTALSTAATCSAMIIIKKTEHYVFMFRAIIMLPQTEVTEWFFGMQ